MNENSIKLKQQRILMLTIIGLYLLLSLFPLYVAFQINYWWMIFPYIVGIGSYLYFKKSWITSIIGITNLVILVFGSAILFGMGYSFGKYLASYWYAVILMVLNIAVLVMVPIIEVKLKKTK